MDEVRQMSALRATCTGEGAPEVSPVEKFKGSVGGVFDCLAPDFETWERDNKGKATS